MRLIKIIAFVGDIDKFEMLFASKNRTIDLPERFDKTCVTLYLFERFAENFEVLFLEPTLRVTALAG